MSAKIFCDKCGDEIPDGVLVNRFIRGDVNVAVRVRYQLKRPEESEVCIKCIREAVNEPEAFVAPSKPVAAVSVPIDPGPSGPPGAVGTEGTLGLPGTLMTKSSAEG